MKIAFGAAVALALAACTQQDGQDANTDVTTDELMVDETADPATTDLELNSSAPATDQAINRTDNQSELGNVADNTADSVGNSVQ